MNKIYADIVLPLAQGAFSYEVSPLLHGDIAPGRCVMVALGEKKIYVGVVWRLYSQRPNYKRIKIVDTYVRHAPVLSAEQMQLWEWIADYYMCTLGEVMRAALPSALKPAGFSSEEFDRDTYRPPSEQYVSLHPSIESIEELNLKLEPLAKRAKRQYGAVMEFVSLVDEQELFSAEVPRKRIDATATVLNELVKREIVELSKRDSTPGELPPLPTKLPTLTAVQSDATRQIEEHFQSKGVVLLHGVTGSGKTEIYINLIDRELRAGRNVLYLIPEIAMTTQLVERIKDYFSERVITYHSNFSERNRVESFRRANLSRGGELILGVRSSLFLPTSNLGLVIVDEEHDASYKNSDFAPRYHARDCAVVLARISGAKVVMGSATPSLESYFNALDGKYGLVTIKERYGGVRMPSIVVSDTMRAVKRGERRAHFNKVLIDRMTEALEAKQQVILFQNRRGFSPYVECVECGWVAACPDCNVTLTLHKIDGRLKCHYCGHSTPAPLICPSCTKGELEPRGFGTEKVEEELAKILPTARIERLDRDSSRSVRSLRAIISSFERRETDILVGTQMITKGFDFEGVSLVGILNADNILMFPDFRASERAFQTMTQVAGRAGRRQTQGEVVIQTSQPDNEIIGQVAREDYEGMARMQMVERREFLYPPYCRIISITLRHRDNALLWGAANVLGDALREVFGRRLLGPQPPTVDRIKRVHLLVFTLKVERTRSFASAKRLLTEAVDELHCRKEYRYIDVVCDVDPQ